ncbi:hypothetical protein EGI22_13820 [Lacihabitans sp. LS3-19]|uniref:MvdC/MvdD family ATP grasp protein n=1 Tax=Lacihabitans sp. LS3-19 TaxID=2487335 RepID=UPI0020CE5C84|nr:hypothetical protein [Lacihabitans sp. LS3-19]MCP9768993.1 hypothetical protein [Lacihabitans sp. LS3-19]
MILILTEQKEDSVNKVIDWLIYYNFEFIRFNESDFISKFEMEINLNSTIKFNLKELKFSEISSVWLRKGAFNYQISNSNANQSITSYLFNEWNSFSNYLMEEFKFHGSLVLGTSNDLKYNKLINLKVALNAGLLIPQTLITDYLNHGTTKFFKENSIVSKAIQDVFTGKLFNKNVGTYAESIKIPDTKTGDIFFPTCLQSIIRKKMDVRVFFLNFSLFAFAIFSSSENLDYRKDDKNSQRIVPFKLPKNLIIKIIKFIRNLDLNCGSIDFIYSTDGKFFFLEVNPDGQFGRLSYECNYYLEKEIADYLCFQKRN